MSLDSILRSPGKNLIDTSWAVYDGLVTKYPQLIISRGSGGNPEILKQVNNLPRNTPLIFSANISITGNVEGVVERMVAFMFEEDSGPTLFTYINDVGGNISFTIPSTKGKIFAIFIYLGETNIATAHLSNLQLELGSTATTYEPYHQGPKSVKIGDKEVLKVSYGSRNLFDISSSVGFQSYYSGVTNTISGTTITTSSTANRGCNLLLGDFPVGTYTISFSNTDFALLMLQYGEALGQLSRLDNVNFVSTKSHTFTLTQPRKLWLESTISTNQTRTITDIQLELGDKATEYVPYSKEVVWINPIFNSTLGNFVLSKSTLL